MKDLKEILKEAKEECHADNCQSADQVALLAMKMALNEYKEKLMRISKRSLLLLINEIENEDFE